MNVAPMILRFVSGIDDAGQPIEEQRRGVHEHQRQLEPLEALADLRGLVEPQHAVVHEDARQLVADGAVKDQRRDRRIDAAAQRADDAPVADLRADPRRRLLDKRRHRPVAGAAADAVGEVAQDLEAAFGVHDLGMKQQRVQAARSASAIAATGALALVATTAKPAGAAATKSPWLAQTRISGGHVGKQRAARRRRRRTELDAVRTVAWPNSRCGAGATRPPSVCAISCMP